MSSASGSAWRDVRRWLPGLLISGIAIFAIFQLVNLEDLDTAFSTIRFIYLLPGVVLVMIWLLVRAMALKVILAGKPGVWQAFRAINIGYLLNNLFPLRAGEFGKAIVLGKSSGLGTSFVLSGIVIERAFDLIFAAGLLLTALPFVLEMNWTRPVAVGVLLLVMTGLLALYLVARNHARIKAWMEGIGKKYAWINKYILPQLDAFFTGLQILTAFRQFLLCLVMIGLSWVVAIILYYLMLYSIAPDPQIWWGVFVNSILAMGIALPSAPAALGVFEASLVAGLKVLGISYSDALAYAVVMHFLQFALTGIFGFFALAREKQSIDSLLSFARNRKSNSEKESFSSESLK